MKGFGRALELNCLFLLVVALLVTLQLILQRRQNGILLQLSERGDEGEGGEEPPPVLQLPDSLNIPDQGTHRHPAGHGKGGDGGVLAAPVVPNIHRSFPKRKAPYVRKAKKNKKKKKNRKGKQQQQQKSEMRGGGGIGRAPAGGIGGNRGTGAVEKSAPKPNNKRGKTKIDKMKTKT